MSKHDPKVTLRQITDYALRAQELCAQNELPAILTDWHKRLAFERVMEVLGEAVKRWETTLSLKWIAQRLPMGSWTCVSNLLNERSRHRSPS
jgi:uncharacterized protein with HEPN domain